jgi:Uma2 family endonuclease
MNALVTHKPVTLADFAVITARPENADRLFELINGELIEVSPGRTSNSQLEFRLAFRVQLFCQEHSLPCYVSGGDGAYQIGADVVAPDFAYKRTPMSDDYPDPVPPLWAVEIISPTDKPDDIHTKRQVYLRAGILYWEIYPKSRSIDVYAPGQPMRTVNADEVLDGGAVLPSFTLKVSDLFLMA